jgi:hypothetical protein
LTRKRKNLYNMGVIKNSQFELPNSITKNYFVLGNDNINYGPTSSSGYYTDIDVPENGYVFYRATSGGKLNGFIANNDTELISIVNRLSNNAGITTAQDALIWLASNSEYFIKNKAIPNIVTDNLGVYYDIGLLDCYPKANNSLESFSRNLSLSTLVNSPQYSSNFGGLLSFDDSLSQYATSPSIPSYNIWTIEAWFKLNSPLDNKETSIVTRAYTSILGGSAPYAMGTLNAPSNYNLSVGFYSTGTWRSTVGFVPSVDTWYHVVGTYDGTTIKQYVDGVLINQAVDINFPTGGASSNTLLMKDFRYNVSPTNYTDGDLAVLRMYGAALTDEQILKNYNAEKDRFTVISQNTAEFYYDPGNSSSYSGSGTSLVNIGTLGNVSGTQGTLSGVVYNSLNYGGVFDFDGGTDTIGFGQYNFGNTITVNAWVYPRNENSINCLMSNAGANTATNGFKMSWNNWTTTNYTMNFEAGNGTAGGTQSTAVNTIVENQWQMITYIFDKVGQTIKFYRNGVEIATASGGSPVANISTNNSNWWIGAIGGNSYFMDALMGEFKVWTSSKSEAEILSEYNSSKTRYGL